MFEFVRTHTRILQFVLVLLIFPSFVFFGIQGYSRFTEGAQASVAHVAGHSITQGEWDAAHREQVERLRRQNPSADARLLDSPELKRQTLEIMVRDRVMLAAADRLHLVVTDDRLQRLFVTDPQFAPLRNPDGSVNKDVLAAQGLSSEGFAQRLRQDFAMRQVLAGIGQSVVAPKGAAATALDAVFQQRELQLQRFDAKDYAAKVAPTPADLEAYYKDPTRAALFQAPEQASIEYVVLDLESVKKHIAVGEEELRNYYTGNLVRYTTPEERRVSHILIKAEQGAPAAERSKARARAEALLAELKKTPGAFAELARKNSEDPGSAEKGGDLDFFARGAMVKAFEDVAFALKPGETSGLVETEFGFHILRLAAVRGGDKRSFEAVRAELQDEVRRQLAQKRYAEAAEQFSNLVYEQSDSLKPVTDRLKLELRSAQGVTRQPAPGASGALASPKFLEALFGNDAVRNKRNTEAVEIGPNQLAAGRIVQYAPAHQRPLDEVRDSVRASVVAAQAADLARKDGQARLEALRRAPATELSGAALVVSRLQTRDLPRPVLDAVLKAKSETLPAVFGVDLGEQGYAVVRLTRVLGRDPIASDPTRGQAQYAQAWGQAETQAYYDALKTRFKVEVSAPAAAASDASK